MKIIMLNFEFPPIGGGGGNANLQLLKEFAGSREIDIDVLTSGVGGADSVEEFASNIIIHRLGIRKKALHFWRRSEVVQWLLKARRKYRRMLQTKDYDFAHCFFGFPTGWVCYRRRKEMPYVVSLRGSDVPGLNVRLGLDYKILGPVFKKIWSAAGVLVACSEGLRQRALRFLPSVDIEVIPNGIDLERFRPGPVRSQSDRLQLITVGRLSVTKRVDLLIEAVGMLREKGCHGRLLVVGGGPEESALRRLARYRGLDEVVSFTGTVDAGEVPQLYRESDIYVSASMQEGMSNAMLEAMASGLPIVTTRCEGVDELVDDNGIVVEGGRPEDISEAVVRLAGDSSLRRRMSLSARKRAEGFSWSAVAEQYLELYKKVLRGRGRRQQAGS